MLFFSYITYYNICILVVVDAAAKYVQYNMTTAIGTSSYPEVSTEATIHDVTMTIAESLDHDIQMPISLTAPGNIIPMPTKLCVFY